MLRYTVALETLVAIELYLILDAIEDMSLLARHIQTE